ncbi:nucleolar complex protein 4 homolog B-like [Daphnia pulex]|uniref:nucleolar complex protein 4 homolog B-like n=1 Tax=Daphnia pulex TaxID=6669 RepID=UPI001EE08687|nr:nucleolar complex protein 4 homolog B-like [Daphnia pulex]
MAAPSTRKRESKQNQREIFDSIKLQTKEVIQSRKNINNIIDIQSNLESDESAVVKASIKALDKIFCHFIANGSLSEQGPVLETDADKKVREWSRERYQEFQDRLFKLIAAEQISLQELSLVHLMHLFQAEGQHPLPKLPEGREHMFPHEFLEKLMLHMLSLEKEATPLLTRFQEFMEYEDILFHLLRVLAKILKGKSNVDEKFLKNLIHILEHITLHNTPPKEEEKTKLFCSNKNHFKWNYGRAKQFFSIIWQQLLKHPLTPSLYKRVLVILPEKVLPHLDKPLLLTDFLMESYRIGGAVSILALHGVFLLMQSHNLEYPDFYTKLYALLEPGVLFVKYRARFFYLLDLFMTSTHIPEYIAAAFAKRLSRLALIAPANIVILLLHFVGNLMIRHRGLVRLMHRPEDQKDITDDPYIMSETDLNACKATESSLWEIKTLQSHVLPEIANTAKFIDRDLPKLEWDVNQDLETTLEDLLEKELKRKYPTDDIPINFEKPTKFACVKHEKLSAYFEL